MVGSSENSWLTAFISRPESTQWMYRKWFKEIQEIILAILDRRGCCPDALDTERIAQYDARSDIQTSIRPCMSLQSRQIHYRCSRSIKSSITSFAFM